MAFLKDRKHAVTFFIIIVIVFTLLGCHRSLNKVCREIESGFFSSEETVRTPAAQLNECAKYANRMLSVVNGKIDAELYEKINNARIELVDALEEKNISDILDANEDLVKHVEKLKTATVNLDLSSANDDFNQLIKDFSSAQRAASETSYNSDVDAFISNTINRFPTNILRLVSFVSLPEKMD